MPKRKAKRARRKSPNRDLNIPKVTWRALKEPSERQDRANMRYFKLETLASATERRLTQGDRFIAPSIQALLGAAPLSALTFTLEAEDHRRFVFRINAINIKKKRGTLAFIVAKDREKLSAIASAEHKHLELLHPRAPKDVLLAYRGGKLFLPDRYRRKDQGREIYAYLAEWPAGFAPLALGKQQQFMMLGKQRHTFTRAETETIKLLLAKMMLRAYDPLKRDGMIVPNIPSGEVYVRKTASGRLRLKLAACPKMALRVAPARLLGAILNARWHAGENTMDGAPEDPRLFFESIVEVAGNTAARHWVQAFLKLERTRKRDAVRTNYIEKLSSCVEM